MELELFHVCGWNLSRPNFGGGESHWNYSNKGAEAGTQAIFKEQWSSCLADAQSSWKGVFGNKGRSQFTKRSYMLMKVYSLYSEGSGGAAGRFYLGFAVFLFFSETVVGYLELLGGWPANASYFCVCVCVYQEAWIASWMLIGTFPCDMDKPLQSDFIHLCSHLCIQIWVLLCARFYGDVNYRCNYNFCPHGAHNLHLVWVFVCPTLRTRDEGLHGWCWHFRHSLGSHHMAVTSLPP